MLESLEKWLAAQGLAEKFFDVAGLGGAAGCSGERLVWPVGWPTVSWCLCGGNGCGSAVTNGMTRWLAHGFSGAGGAILPLVMVIVSVDLLFSPQAQAAEVVRRLARAFLVLAGIRIITSFPAAALRIYDSHDLARERSLPGYVEVVKIIL
jgi:hypothetical protein